MVTLFLANDAMAQWFLQNSGTTKNLYSVHFTDANIGYAVGDSGIILKTTNGGTNWAPQNSGVTLALLSVHFPSIDTGYVVGSDSTILKTTDGGIHWINQASTGGSGCYNEWLYSVFFTDADTGYAAGYMWYTNPVIIGGGVLLKTVTGGIDWTVCYTGGTWTSFRSVYFTSPTTGFVVGYTPILKTINAGLSWIVEPNWEIHSLSVNFPTRDTGYIVGSDKWQGSGEYNLGKTTNGGGNWTYQNIGISDTLTSVYFTDTEHGYVVSESGIIRNTDNGGTDWTIQYSGSAMRLSSVYFVNENIGYVVGNSGTILKTTNGGVVGLNEIGAISKLLHINPNPASSSITIETPAKGSLSILNLNGQETITRQISLPKTQIDISNLPSGVYFVRVTGEKTVQVGKMIKE